MAGLQHAEVTARGVVGLLAAHEGAMRWLPFCQLLGVHADIDIDAALHQNALSDFSFTAQKHEFIRDS
jgi:hypothetical protein